MRKLDYFAVIVGVAMVAYGLGCSKGKGQRPTNISMVDDASLYESRPSRFSDRYAAAIRLVAEGKFPEAERLYRKLAKEDDASPDAFVGLGSCCMERGDVAGAQEFYKRAREKGPNSLGVLIGLGSVYLVQSDYSNAIVEFEAALKVKESSAEAHYGLAFAQAKVAETGLARGHLDRFRELAPGSSRIRDLEQLLGQDTPQPSAPPNAAPPHR